MAALGGIDQLREAAIDGRTENVRYRQNELQSLHASLRNNVDAILSAISEDGQGVSKVVTSEARSEFYLAMNATRQLYQSLNFEQSLKDEYKIANGADNTNRRIGKGLVILRPTRHTRFYSVISALATSITAGNCTFLELGNTMLAVDRVLKDLLPQALDSDTFYISSTVIEDRFTLDSALLVDQNSTSSISQINQLASNSSARTVAVVDRAADVELAAKAIVTARFSFQGTSPYSPDLVLVNDFIKSDFVQACTRHASKFFSSSSKSRRAQSSSESVMKKAIKDAELKGQVSTFGSNDFVILDIHDRSAPITSMKVGGCYLPIVQCTSLVDSVMFQKSENDLLAVYVFTDAPSAKFLGQSFNARATYVNQIPVHLLLGPAAPSTSLPIPAVHKYSVDMFSSQRPQYISLPLDEISVIEKLLDSSQQSEDFAVAVRKIHKSAIDPLPKTGQGPGHAIGFFEQGILLGVGLFLSVMIPTLGYSSWFLGKSAWKVVRSRMS